MLTPGLRPAPPRLSEDQLVEVAERLFLAVQDAYTSEQEVPGRVKLAMKAVKEVNYVADATHCVDLMEEYYETELREMGYELRVDNPIRPLHEILN